LIEKGCPHIKTKQTTQQHEDLKRAAAAAAACISKASSCEHSLQSQSAAPQPNLSPPLNPTICPMSINSVSKRSSNVAQEDLKMKPPLTGSFKGLSPPRGDESMEEVCAKVIADARAGLNDIDPDELSCACKMCDQHGRDVKQFQEKKPGAVASRLTPSLVASLGLYTAELSGESPYGACNGALRAADRGKCKPFVPFIWHVMHAMAKCERYEGGNVYRGVKADLSADYPKDREVTWFQFSSCTCDIQVEQSEQFCGSQGTRTLFSIELTTGRARIITKFSLVPSEAEVLLPPNSRFKVVSQFDAGNGLVIIQLKELPPKDPIIDFDAPLSAAAAPSAAPSAAAAAASFAAGSTLLAPLSIVPAPSIPPASWPSLLQQFQAALTPQSVASVTYYRDVAFAAAVCGELSDSDAAEAALADAAHYAAASKQLHNIVAGQGSPTSAESLASLLAQVKHAAPQIEAAKDPAKTAKDYSKASELQELRWGAHLAA